MDLLKELTGSLDQELCKKFYVFLQRHSGKPDRKDKLLFDFYLKHPTFTREDVLKELYAKDRNVEAYHATRKRLIRQLTEFLSAEIPFSEEEGEGRKSYQLFSIARYLFHKNKEEAGWYFLKEAAGLAQLYENFHLLNDIFSFQIQKSHSEYAPDLPEILLEKEKYQKLAIEDDNANSANHLIRYELKKSLAALTPIDLNTLTDQVLQRYKLGNAVLERPRIMFNMVSITRSAILASKDFYSFETYAKERYLELEKRKLFNQYNYTYKLSFIYYIAHVLYRNKKFSESANYLDQLREGMTAFGKRCYDMFYTKYNVLLAAVLNYSGQNNMAIETLEQMLKDKRVLLNKTDLMNVYLNLSIYYFQQEQYGKSVKLFQQVQQSEAWQQKVMGMEWLLKKRIIECINQFELGNTDIVEARLTSIERKFSEVFKRPVYHRVKVFLNLVRLLNENPAVAATKEFADKVEESFEFIDATREDIQAMTFYGWLKAKMVRKRYYEVLLGLCSLKK